MDSYLLMAPNPTIIWDMVAVTLEIEDDRIEVGSNATITWTGVYEYDGSPFTGTIVLNDTLTKGVPGEYHYAVQSISDGTHGMTVFGSNAVSVTFEGTDVREPLPWWTIGTAVAIIAVVVGVIFLRRRK